MSALVLAMAGFPADPFDTPEVRIELALESVAGALEELREHPRLLAAYRAVLADRAADLANLAQGTLQ